MNEKILQIEELTMISNSLTWFVQIFSNRTVKKQYQTATMVRPVYVLLWELLNSFPYWKSENKQTLLGCF